LKRKANGISQLNRGIRFCLCRECGSHGVTISPRPGAGTSHEKSSEGPAKGQGKTAEVTVLLYCVENE
jgi:hypothetical protein